MKLNHITLLMIITFNINYAQNNFLDFDGQNDWVWVNSSNYIMSGATSLSLSCKVYPKNTNPVSSNLGGIAGYRNDSLFDFYIMQISSNTIEARFRNASGYYTINYNGLVLNQWNHFFLVYDGSNLKLYSNNILVGSINATGNVPTLEGNGRSFLIGELTSGLFSLNNNYFKGSIDEVSLWNKALSAVEITNIINNSGEIANPQNETQLKLYYKFNQGVAYEVNTGLTTLVNEMGNLNGNLFEFNLFGTYSNWGGYSLSNEEFISNKFKLYPNPTNDSFVLSVIEGKKNNLKSVELYNFLGQKVKEFSIQEHYSIQEMTSGVYFVKLISNSNVALQNIRIIKN